MVSKQPARIISLLLLLIGLTCAADSLSGHNTERDIPQLSVKGAIGPAVADYLVRGITDANDRHSPLVIITLDTPGGLVSSLRDINQAILGSNVPVACLVHPQGARAASAGTYMLYACHIAAMAPATTLGAATPVAIGSPTGKQQEEKEQSATAMERKVLNDSIAYIRSLAQLRHRNVDWAEKAVKEAATLTAAEALENNVINLIAADPAALKARLDGQSIETVSGTVQLNLSASDIRSEAPDWRNRFIATITDPNIAYFLLLIGFYGLLLEFYSPGVGVAGVTGAISLIIALYAFQLLPVNYAGMLLLLLGIGLLVAESMVPSFGIFGFGGLAAFVAGSIFLLDSDLSQFQIALPVIAALSVATGAFFVVVLGFLWRARNAKAVSGIESLIGAHATAVEDFSGTGRVLVEGEVWTAHCDRPIQANQIVIINRVDGLELTVTPQQERTP